MLLESFFLNAANLERIPESLDFFSIGAVNEEENEEAEEEGEEEEKEGDREEDELLDGGAGENAETGGRARTCEWRLTRVRA